MPFCAPRSRRVPATIPPGEWRALPAPAQGTVSYTHLDVYKRQPVCRDTGYVGDAPARFCACFERRLAMGEQGGQGAQTFETFNAAFAPEEGGQRSRLVEVKNELENFADRYPDTRWHNIMLMLSLIHI